MTEFQEFIEDALANNIWTDDVPRIMLQEDWYVFAYDKKKATHSTYYNNNEDECLFVGNGWTKSSIYTILNIQDSKTESQLVDLAGKYKILGEVWKVSSSKLLMQDYDQCNLLKSKRLFVPITLRSGQTVNCWMYITDRDYLLKGNIKVSTIGRQIQYGDTTFLEVP